MRRRFISGPAAADLPEEAILDEDELLAKDLPFFPGSHVQIVIPAQEAAGR